MSSLNDRQFVARPYSLPKQGAQYQLKKAGMLLVERDVPVLAEYEKETIPDYLAAIDHSLVIESREDYKAALKREQSKLNELARKLKGEGRSLIVALQGRDGAGKGGTSKRIEEALGNDFKLFDSVPIGPPTEEERAHSWLWRFYRHDRMPGIGQVRVFDRCWAERVLVEKVMKFAHEKDIQKSYRQLRVFEWQLVEQGTIVIKIWLDVTKDQQKRRFARRRAHKPWKVSPFDLISRKHWDDYTPAANELFHRTGTEFAPWHLISSEDKRYARLAALKLINKILKKELSKKRK